MIKEIVDTLESKTCTFRSDNSIIFNDHADIIQNLEYFN